MKINYSGAVFQMLVFAACLPPPIQGATEVTTMNTLLVQILGGYRHLVC